MRYSCHGLRMLGGAQTRYHLASQDANGARAHAQEHIAIACLGDGRRRHVGNGAYKGRHAAGARLQGLAQGAAVGAGNGCLAGAVDLGQ